jgi:hypothetical protein
MVVVPTSHLPPFGTHSPPRARAMIWCPKQIPEGGYLSYKVRLSAEAERTEHLDLRFVPYQRGGPLHEPVDPFAVLVCRRS